MYAYLDFDEAVINVCQCFSPGDGIFGFERQVQLCHLCVIRVEVVLQSRTPDDVAVL